MGNYLYTNFKPRYVKIRDFTLYLNPKDRVLSDILIKNHIWESFETKIFLKTVKNGNVVLDIGANVGYYTLIASKKVGKKGKVYAFEPDEDNFRILEKNVQVNKCNNVVLVKKAVADKTGQINLYLNPVNTGDHRIYKSIEVREILRIQSVKLDDYFKGKENSIDVIKMDIQGAEGKAIAGMEEIFKKNSRLEIITEFWPMGLYLSGIKPHKFLDRLEKYRYRFYMLSDKDKWLQEVSKRYLLAHYENAENKYSVADESKYANLLCLKRVYP
jgi:FkbM family methyltransferase